MANTRAVLAVHELEGAHVPIPTSAHHRSPVALSAPLEETSGDAFKYPDLVGKKKDRMVSTSFRLPVSQVDALEDLKLQKGVVPSELVRRLIADFLATLG
jgi:hypothetical protein